MKKMRLLTLLVFAFFGITSFNSKAQDVGVLSYVSPASPMCTGDIHAITVRIKNYGSSTIDFSAYNFRVNVKIDNFYDFGRSLYSGTLAVGATMDVVVTTSHNVIVGWSGTVDAYTELKDLTWNPVDVNPSNDAMAQVNVAANKASPTLAIPMPTGNCAPVIIEAFSDPGVTYHWENNSVQQTHTVNTSGTYAVTVTAANGCKANDSIQLIVNAAPVVNLGADVEQCGGSATLDAGNAGSTYLWSNASTSQTLNVSTSGSYAVTVTDGMGCHGSDNVFVSIVTSAPLADLGPDVTPCGGPATLDPGYHQGCTYLWSDASTFQAINVFTNGTYSVSITNACGTTSDNVNVTFIASPIVNLGPPQDLCPGGIIDAGNAGSTYIWSTGATTQTIIPTSPGLYWVTVTNSCGQAIGPKQINNIRPLPTVFVSATSTSICAGNQVALFVSGDAYSYEWSHGVVDGVSFPPATTTTYIATGTSAYGCVNTNSITITVNICCNVNIPDAAFKAELLGNTSINTNSNTEIECSEASAYTGTLDVSSLSISNLTGIEAFTSLTDLNCASNQLTSLNVSANVALTRLICGNNLLTSLTLPVNTILTELNCAYNQIPSLNVSAYTALTILEFGSNQVAIVDVSANTALSVLQCYTNQLTSLNVYSNTALTELYCDGNLLTSLNVSANTALTKLNCASNQLTSLNVSANLALTNLQCDYNQLTSLNVSANTALRFFFCNNNLLTSLNLKNGNNSNFVAAVLNNNPSLTCIQVDDVAYSNSNWTWKDAWASYNLICLTCVATSTNNPQIICEGNNYVFNSHTYSLPGNYNDTLLSILGCDSIIVTQLTVIPTFLPVISGLLSYCAGTNTTLDAGVHTSYLWSNSATTQTINATAGTYTVTVTNASGCTGVSASVVVNANALPTPLITGSLSYCAGTNTTLDAGVHTSYLWSNSATTQTINATATLSLKVCKLKSF